MSGGRYTTAFAHLILAGSSAWTYRMLGSVTSCHHCTWAFGVLGLFFMKSCVGVVRFGHPDRGESLRNLYDHILFLSTSFALPCFTTELYIHHNYLWEIAVVHAASGLLPLWASKINTSSQNDAQRIIVFLNAISLTYLGYTYDNYYAVSSAMSYLMIYFGIKTQGTVGDVPSLDLFIIGLSFFNFFMYKALTY